LLEVDDGRCPTDVLCFWVGNANISLKMTNGDRTEYFTLDTGENTNDGLNFSKSAIVLNHKVELLELMPMPVTDIVYTIEDFTVDISVTRE